MPSEPFLMWLPQRHKNYVLLVTFHNKTSIEMLGGETIRKYN